MKLQEICLVFYVSDVFVVTRSHVEMTEVVNRLMDSLFQVLAAVTGLEASVKTSTVAVTSMSVTNTSHHSKID